mgnify:CR=1 FL=1
MNQLQTVLDALEDAGYYDSAIDIVKQMMQAEPVSQYRVRNCADWYDGFPDTIDGKRYETRTLYSAPQEAQVRKPLTHEQIQSAYIRAYNGGDHGRDFENAFCREIEKAHGIV